MENITHTAPLYEFLKEKAGRGEHRFCVPGHKGKNLFEIPPESIDFTELDDTGDLYRGDSGPIREAERMAARVYGAESCFFLTGGSTLGIQTAVSLFRGKKLLAMRDSHRAFTNALMLTGTDADFIYGETIPGWGIMDGLRAKAVEKAIERDDYAAVYLTSPTYYGVFSDIAGISCVCKKRGIPLIVDCAHGAHLPFSQPDKNPLACGADIAIFSAHKTLGCLGQGAMLLISDMQKLGLNERTVRNQMSVFGTSSPSYAVMASMDLAIKTAYENQGAYQELARYCERLADSLRGEEKLRALTSADTGFGADSIRLVINTANADISGSGLAARLYDDFGIISELSDSENVVFIMSGFEKKESFDTLESALLSVSRELTAGKDRTGSGKPGENDIPVPEGAMSPREAYMSDSEEICLSAASGRVAAEEIGLYPPGVPMIIPGEKICQKTIAFLRNKGYNIDKDILVIKHNAI